METTGSRSILRLLSFEGIVFLKQSFELFDRASKFHQWEAEHENYTVAKTPWFPLLTLDEILNLNRLI